LHHLLKLFYFGLKSSYLTCPLSKLPISLFPITISSYFTFWLSWGAIQQMKWKQMPGMIIRERPFDLKGGVMVFF
jgi:hypothetical protein